MCIQSTTNLMLIHSGPQLRDTLKQKFQQPAPNAIRIAFRLPDDGGMIEYGFSPTDVTKVSCLS